MAFFNPSWILSFHPAVPWVSDGITSAQTEGHPPQSQTYYKYSLLMHCIKIKSPVKFLLNEQYVFVGGNISFLCVLSCSSEEA